MTETISVFGADARGETFKFFPTCRLVKGGAYSAIYDLHRRLIFRFSSEFHPLFAACETDGVQLRDLADLDRETREKALEALRFLKEREIACIVDDVSARWLRPISDRWDSPHAVLSAIVDVETRMPDWDILIPALDDQLCRGLQIRCFSNLVTPHLAKEVLLRLDGGRIVRVEFVVEWSPAWEEVDWTALFGRFRNLHVVRLHAAPDDRDIAVDDAALRGRLVRFERGRISGASHCGSITPRTLSMPSADLFSELKRFNGCLNRKISVRSDGEICNCPSMTRTFGRDLGKLGEILASPEFQQPWKIRKDEIEVCRGCEFRYVCTDCRAYLGDDDSVGKSSRCGYDPLTGAWASGEAEGALDGRLTDFAMEAADV